MSDEINREDMVWMKIKKVFTKVAAIIGDKRV